MESEVTVDPSETWDEVFQKLYALLRLRDAAFPGEWERLVSALEVLELVTFELFERPEPDAQMLRALTVVWQRCDEGFRASLARYCLQGAELRLRASLRTGGTPSLQGQVLLRLLGLLVSSFDRPLFCAQA